MLHKVSQMCDKIDVIHKKSLELRKLKYSNPPGDKTEVDILVQDIQSLCRDIANDTSPYEK